MGTRGGFRVGAGGKKGRVTPKTKELISILEHYDYCPVSELVEAIALAKEDYFELRSDDKSAAQISLGTVIDGAKGLLPYLYPKRKSVEVTGEDGVPLAETFAGIVNAVLNPKE